MTATAVMLGKTDDDHAQAAMEAEREIICAGLPQADVVGNGAIPGDANRIVSSAKQALRDADGRVIGIFGIAGYITVRRAIEMRFVAQSIELDG